MTGEGEGENEIVGEREREQTSSRESGGVAWQGEMRQLRLRRFCEMRQLGTEIQVCTLVLLIYVDLAG